MKKNFCFLATLFALFSTLSAQTTDTPENPPASISPSDPSISTPISIPSLSPSISFPIGTISQPVVAGEYCAFLTDTLAPQSEPSLNSLKEKFGITTAGPLSCDGSFNNYNFYWDLNRSNEIITTVPSAEVQQLFNHWRDNPYSQELLDYMLDVYYTSPIGSKVGKNHTQYAPSNILQLYPNSTTLSKARNMGLYPVAGKYLLYNERGISVSLDPHNPINPKNFIGINRYQLAPTDYHRPVLIGPTSDPLKIPQILWKHN